MSNQEFTKESTKTSYNSKISIEHFVAAEPDIRFISDHLNLKEGAYIYLQ